MSSRRLIMTVAACAALAGCNTVNKTSADIDPGFGEAAAYDAALQIINPAPVYAENGAQPGDNGERAANAVKRYRLDQVNARHKAEAQAARSSGLSTTQQQGGGSGGGPR